MMRFCNAGVRNPTHAPICNRPSGIAVANIVTGSGPWATVTSKQKRAEQLIKQGQAIQLWSAEQLYAALELEEEPPF